MWLLIRDNRLCLGAGDYVGSSWPDTWLSIRPPADEFAALDRRRACRNGARRSGSHCKLVQLQTHCKRAPRAAANAGPDPAAGARMEAGSNGLAAPALVDSMD